MLLNSIAVSCDTENNGGFASVRTRNIEPAADLAAYEGLALRVCKRGNCAVVLSIQQTCRVFTSGISHPSCYTNLSRALQVKGNGLRFKCIVRTESNWDGIAYCR